MSLFNITFNSGWDESEIVAASLHAAMVELCIVSALVLRDGRIRSISAEDLNVLVSVSMTNASSVSAGTRHPLSWSPVFRRLLT